MGWLELLPDGSPEVFVSGTGPEGARPIIGGGSTSGFTSHCVGVDACAISSATISNGVDTEPHPEIIQALDLKGSEVKRHNEVHQVSVVLSLQGKGLNGALEVKG